MDEVQQALDEARRERKVNQEQTADKDEDDNDDGDDTAKVCEQSETQDDEQQQQQSDTLNSPDDDETLHLSIVEARQHQDGDDDDDTSQSSSLEDHTASNSRAQEQFLFDETVEFAQMEQQCRSSAIPQVDPSRDSDQQICTTSHIPQHSFYADTFDEILALDTAEQAMKREPEAPLASPHQAPLFIRTMHQHVFDETVALDSAEERLHAIEQGTSDDVSNTHAFFDETLAMDVAEAYLQVTEHAYLEEAQGTHNDFFDETVAFDVAEDGLDALEQDRSEDTHEVHSFFDESVAFDAAEQRLEEAGTDDTVSAQESVIQQEDDALDHTLTSDVVEDARPSETQAQPEAPHKVDDIADAAPQLQPPNFDETIAFDAAEDRIAAFMPDETLLLDELEDRRAIHADIEDTTASRTSFSFDSPGIGRSRASNTTNDIIHQPWSPAQPRDARNNDSFDFNQNPKAAFSPMNVPHARHAATPLSERSTNILPMPTSPHMHKLREARDAFLLRSPAKVRSGQAAAQQSPARKPPQRITIASPAKVIHRPELSSPAKAIRHGRTSPERAMQRPCASPTRQPLQPRAASPDKHSQRPPVSPTRKPLQPRTASPTKQGSLSQRPMSPVKVVASAKAHPTTRLPKSSVAAATSNATSLSRIARPIVTAQQRPTTATPSHRQQQPTSASSASTGCRIAGSTRMAAPRPAMHRPSSSTSSASSSGGSEMLRPVKRAVAGASTSRIGVPLQASKLPAMSGGVAQRSAARPTAGASDARSVPLYKKPIDLSRPGAISRAPQQPSQSQHHWSPSKPTAPTSSTASSPIRPRVNLSSVKILRHAHHTSSDGERPRARRVAADSREAVFAPEPEPTVQPAQPAHSTAPLPARPSSPVKVATMPVPNMLPNCSGKSIRPRRSQVAAMAEKADVFSEQDELSGGKEEAVSAAAVQVDGSPKETDMVGSTDNIHASSEGSDTLGRTTRRTSSRRAVPRSSVGPALTRRPGKQVDAVPSVPISSSALASLTTRNSRKNESFYARIEVQVIRMECPRPPSPTSKIRRSANASSSSSSSTARADRAKKRAAEIVAGEAGAAVMISGRQGESDEQHDDDEYEHDCPSRSTHHRMGAGDDEVYTTPIRRSNNSHSQRRRRQVRWHKGLFSGPRTTTMSAEHTWPNKSSMVRKAYGLDRHGNVRAADGPPDAAWCIVVVPVRKMIYDDDDDDESNEE